MFKTKRFSSIANLVGLFVALCIVFIFFSVKVPNGVFYSPGNLETLARQTAIVAMAALGMTCIIIAGGIDLSVGSVVALVTVVIAVTMRAGGDPFVAVLAGLGAG